MNILFRAMSPFKYGILAVLAIGLALGSACSRDPEQRTAYKVFLEDVLSMQGYQSLPELTPEQVSVFGPAYSLSYQALFDFTRSMEGSIDTCAKKMAVISENVSAPADIVEHMNEIAEAREFISGQPAVWNEQLEELTALKTGFSLHEDVASLYERIFVKYTNPVKQVLPVLQAMLDFLDGNLVLARYVSDNFDKIEFNGNMIIFSDEAAHQKGNAILADINDKAQELYRRQDELSRYLIINKE